METTTSLECGPNASSERQLIRSDSQYDYLLSLRPGSPEGNSYSTTEIHAHSPPPSMSPLQSPIDFTYYRETTRSTQRSRSTYAPQRRSANSSRHRRRSSPARRTKSIDSFMSPTEIVDPELRKVVLDMFAMISQQEISPLRIGKPTSGDQPQLVDIVELLNKERGRKKEANTRSGPGRSISRPKAVDFSSMKWFQQKRLLERELRRLKKWDCTLREDEVRLSNSVHDSTVTEAALTSIGNILVELVNDDPRFKQYVDCIPLLSTKHIQQREHSPGRRRSLDYRNSEDLSRRYDDPIRRRSVTFADNERLPTDDDGNDIIQNNVAASQSVIIDHGIEMPKPRGDPLKDIQKAIDDLFETLTSLKKRKRDRPVNIASPVVSNVDTGEWHISRRSDPGPYIDSINQKERLLQKSLAAEPRTPRLVRFFRQELSDSSSDEESTHTHDTKIRKTCSAKAEDAKAGDAEVSEMEVDDTKNDDAKIAMKNSDTKAEGMTTEEARVDEMTTGEVNDENTVPDGTKSGEIKVEGMKIDDVKSENVEAEDMKARDMKTEPSHGHGRNPDTRVVLKIAHRPGAFRETNKTHDSTGLSSTAKIERPEIQRVPSSDVPLRRLMQDFDSLGESFSQLSFASQLSSTGITDTLLSLANAMNAGNSTMSHKDILHRLDCILGLFTSLPFWVVYTDSGDHKHARIAMSMIYFSLLDELVSCAVDFSKKILFKMDPETEKAQDDVRFFCACIQRLSTFNEDVGKGFGPLQHQLRRVVSKLMALGFETGPSSPDPTGQDAPGSQPETPSPICKNCTLAPDSDAEDTTSTLRLSQNFAPLSLACYLASANDEMSADVIEAGDSEIPSGLVTVLARDLFDLPDQDMLDSTNTT